MKPFFVYMLRCKNGSYYVGSTDDLETRVNQHHHGTYDGHTSRLRPVQLVWSTETPTRDEALLLEFRVKRWSRAKKEALVVSDWAALKRAARGPDRARREGSGRPMDPVGPSTPALRASARGDRVGPAPGEASARGDRVWPALGRSLPRG